eukprot:TRINITY_DN2739_c0_g1_i1.p1 TRINITY_DN2739_c0_g1~~TRINITY_DN2739_c0_g1_i1.p1  ORF type:complete len:282 (+),score=40.31 TRINITY_DN2739_c0_g1_i1:744-1589(+)
MDKGLQVDSTAEIKAQWDAFANLYEKTADVNLFPVALTLINMINVEEARDIVEVGCGTGKLSQEILRRRRPDARLTSTDISSEMISKTRARLLAAGPVPNLEIREEDNEALVSISDNTTDAYIAALSLHIVSDPEKMLSEAFRILRPGGRAIFSIWGRPENSPIFNIPRQVLAELGIPQKRRDNFHLGSDLEGLRKLLEKQGFTNVIAWYQFAPFREGSPEEFSEFYLQRLLKNFSGEQAAQIEQKSLDKVRQLFSEKHEPLGLECLIVMGSKPSGVAQNN